MRLMLDVHKASVTACVRISEESKGLHQEIREFATTTRGLLLLRDWLATFEVTLVGMEATGVHWKPIYYMLEDDFELWLLNARHLKGTSPAGRPTSRTPSGSASWWSTGLYAPALCHRRRSGSLGILPATARLKNRRAHQGGTTSGEGAPGCRDKVLFCGHPRAWCLRKGFCADALVGGTTDPEVLAELARGRLRSKLPALRDALEGCLFSHHALMVGKTLAHIDYLDELSAEVERVIAPFSKKVELLDTIPGVDRKTAETLIAEIGTDMGQFPTHRHLASWA
jgi:transposase